MACKSCSTGKDGAPSGCRSNGTCGTGGCNKLNVYNWLSDMVLPQGQNYFLIVEIRFKGSRKEFYYNKENIELKVGDVVQLKNGSHNMMVKRYDLKTNKLDNVELFYFDQEYKPITISLPEDMLEIISVD